MTITNGYCTLVELKARLAITDVTDDTMLEQIITSVSRWIDDYTARRFYAAAETRYYTATDTDLLKVYDLLSVTALKTDEDGDRVYENTWANTDYDLLPDNAVLDGEPYTKISLTPYGNYYFPVGVRKGILLQGTYGYCSALTGKGAIVKEACLLQSERIFKRKDSPLGVAGMTVLGVQTVKVPGLDPDVQEMLVHFRCVL